MRVLFLMPVPSHVRFQKRIRRLSKLGVEPSALAFERAYYKGKPLPFEWKSLGRISNGNYLARLPKLAATLPRVLNAARHADVVYAFGQDLAALGATAISVLPGRRKLVYEVGDIREVLTSNGLAGRVFRQIEASILSRTDIFVTTSPDFLDHFYQGPLKPRCAVVIENKPEPDALPPPEDTAFLASDKIRIGYFGILRCRASWATLKLLGKQSSFQIVLRGVPSALTDLESVLRELPGIQFGGPYVSPDELPSLYNGVDLVWACNPRRPGPGNWCWARANRFYEACYFRRPLIAQVGTADGREVERLGIGLTVDPSHPELAAAAIRAISREQLKEWHTNLSKLDPSVYLEQNEHELLWNKLRE